MTLSRAPSDPDALRVMSERCSDDVPLGWTPSRSSRRFPSPFRSSMTRSRTPDDPDALRVISERCSGDVPLGWTPSRSSRRFPSPFRSSMTRSRAPDDPDALRVISERCSGDVPIESTLLRSSRRYASMGTFAHNVTPKLPFPHLRLPHVRPPQPPGDEEGMEYQIPCDANSLITCDKPTDSETVDGNSPRPMVNMGASPPDAVAATSECGEECAACRNYCGEEPTTFLECESTAEVSDRAVSSFTTVGDECPADSGEIYLLGFAQEPFDSLAGVHPLSLVCHLDASEIQLGACPGTADARLLNREGEPLAVPEWVGATGRAEKLAELGKLFADIVVTNEELDEEPLVLTESSESEDSDAAPVDFQDLAPLAHITQEFPHSRHSPAAVWRLPVRENRRARNQRRLQAARAEATWQAESQRWRARAECKPSSPEPVSPGAAAALEEEIGGDVVSELLTVGVAVELRNFQNAPEFNGRRGILQGACGDDDGRFAVRLDTGEMKAVKPCHVFVLDACATQPNTPRLGLGAGREPQSESSVPRRLGLRSRRACPELTVCTRNGPQAFESTAQPEGEWHVDQLS